MNIELTRDAKKAAAKIYKEYLNRIDNGLTKSEAKIFSDSDMEMLFKNEDFDDIKSELVSTFSMKTNILEDITLSSSFISFMENRFKNGIKDVVGFLSQFIP